MNFGQLGDLVKQKYQQYVQHPSEELGQKVVEKYPEYKQRITDAGQSYLDNYYSATAPVEGQKVRNVAKGLLFPSKEEAQQTAQSMSMGPEQFKQMTSEQGKRLTDQYINFAGISEPVKNLGQKKVFNIPKISKQIDDLISVAKKQQQQFSKDVSSFSKLSGIDFSIGPIKEKARILEKVTKEVGGDVSKIKDVNRSVVFIDNFSNNLNMMTERAKSYFGDRVVGVKSPKDNDIYKKTIINVLGDSGQPMEVQITTKPMWDAKIKYGDTLYHKYRSMTDLKSDEATKLWNEMFDLYDKAYKKTN